MSTLPLYCFCFIPGALQSLAAARDLGLDDCGWEDPVRVVAVAGLGAVVSAVPAERFIGTAAEARLADPDWLLPRAAAHDRVITRMMGHGTVFPLRFGTLFSSLAPLATEVAGRRHLLQAFFARMPGREEWAVKVLLERAQALDALLSVRYPQASVPRGGRAYLQQQRRRSEAERDLLAWLAAPVASIEARVAEQCEALVPRPPNEPVLLNLACLLTGSGAAALAATLDVLARDYADLGLRLHCSGPWPLYSFCAGV